MQVKFSGSVSAQAQAGEPVVITVTKPDATTDTFTTTTLADRTFTFITSYSVAGGYNARAHGDEDAIYSAWDSNNAPFTITLTPRTGTLTVTLT